MEESHAWQVSHGQNRHFLHPKQIPCWRPTATNSGSHHPQSFIQGAGSHTDQREPQEVGEPMTAVWVDYLFTIFFLIYLFILPDSAYQLCSHGEK